MNRTPLLWRGSLLPLGREAAPLNLLARCFRLIELGLLRSPAGASSLATKSQRLLRHFSQSALAMCKPCNPLYAARSGWLQPSSNESSNR